jgi:hypothetical protein
MPANPASRKAWGAFPSRSRKAAAKVPLDGRTHGRARYELRAGHYSAINLRDAQIAPSFGTLPLRLGHAASGVFFVPKKMRLPPRPTRS